MTPLGELIDKLFELRNTKRKINAELTTLEEEITRIEDRVLATMDAIGTDTGRTKLATATASSTSRYNIENYDDLVNWILEKPEERIYLFERRLGQNATKELIEIAGADIPGTHLATRNTVRLTKR